ncbi:hypothetical protein HBI25_179590 [Parastagonospora nodorum]|nr:hypothetical protein HBI80_186210 [Parastagonospora nodorum]KAH5037552.1 hypothetical protein HBI75_073990 [Parastagonospora nodorum]KAH5512259.1 hypothetical protein HBI29_106870 [Parastagonospora nodorum]KAH5552615.1 hypothetical protein HBI25_179590 [Parastagonospora nodorum]KAH5582957.1 hypothetical protein HBI26_120020 [Parastagonospora nodorum]
MKCSTIFSAIIGSASASVLPRQACLPLKHSVAPGPVPNTVESFGNYPFYSEIAKVVVSPAGFEPIAKAASAAVNSASYMHIINLDSYDVSACAQHCDATGGCEAFNTYFQRNPSVDPAAACPNPSANTLVVCGLYSQAINEADITNEGQGRGPIDANGQAFEVVIRGSNVYNRVAKLASSPAKETVTVTVTAPCTASSMVDAFTNPLVPFLTPGPVAFPKSSSASTTSTTHSASVTSAVVGTSSSSKSTRSAMFTPSLISEPLTWSFAAPTTSTKSIASATKVAVTTLASSFVRQIW